jgi:hypothetical protein
MERERERAKQLQESLDEQRVLARNLKYTLSLAVLLLVFAVAATMWALQQRDAAQRQRELAEQRARNLEVAEAFRLLGQTSPLSPMARERFSDVAGRLRRLGLDPIMALHYSLAADIQQIRPISIVAVEGEVSYIRVSRDGDLVVVVYHYQNYGGNPDIEDIPDWTAVALYRLSTSEWILKHRLDSAIGREVYDMHESEVIGLDSPHHLILSQRQDGGAEMLLRFSLHDGSMGPCDQPICGEYAKAFKQSKANDVPKELEQYLDSSTLFRVLPDDGIDVEYGPRLVDMVFVTSPDRRTALVGTYEGRLLLLDLAAARVRGEQHFGPIYAAAYQYDGARAFFTDRNELFKLDTSGWSSIREAASAFRIEPGKSMREGSVLATTLSDDASLLAMVTERHLLGLIVRENRWIVWELPREIKKAAALRIDHERHVIDLVVGDDGTLISGDYRGYPSPLNVSLTPTGGHATVAWLDTDQPGAWLSEITVEDRSVRIRLVPMPGHTVTPLEMSVRLRSNGQKELTRGEGQLTIHAIARIENQLILFYGDADVYADRKMWDERMTIVPIGGCEQQRDHVVFRAEHQVDNLGEVHWTSDHVEGLLPGSHKGRMLALASGPRIVAVKSDGSTEPTGESLASRDYVDHDQVYSFGVTASVTGPWLTVRHLKTETTLRHQLPWIFKAEPGFAAIGGGGQHIAVVSTKGDVLFVDLSVFAAHNSPIK